MGYPIRTDFREILAIIEIWSDPNYENDEKAEIMYRRIFPEWRNMPRKDYVEALTKAKEFIDMGIKNEHNVSKPQTMDWEQDAPIIIPCINKVLGYEIRAKEYVHWWTFLSAYMEIEGGVYSTVLEIRQKKSKGKKLETYEKEFYRENKSLVDIKKKYTAEEEEERARLLKMLGG